MYVGWRLTVKYILLLTVKYILLLSEILAHWTEES